MAATLKEVTRAAARTVLEQHGGKLTAELIADTVVAAALGHLNRGSKSVEIGSILSASTKEGRVEIKVGSEVLQLDLAKARDIYAMLGGAIEAAVTDQIVWQAMTEAGLPDHAAGRFLLTLREKRQGSTGTVYAS